MSKNLYAVGTVFQHCHVYAYLEINQASLQWRIQRGWAECIPHWHTTIFWPTKIPSNRWSSDSKCVKSVFHRGSIQCSPRPFNWIKEGASWQEGFGRDKRGRDHPLPTIPGSATACYVAGTVLDKRYDLLIIIWRSCHFKSNITRYCMNEGFYWVNYTESVLCIALQSLKWLKIYTT